LSTEVLQDILPPERLAKDVSGFKFKFFLEEWQRYEKLKEWGDKMQRVRQLWSDIIFAA
jgi:hypothetical protein